MIFFLYRWIAEAGTAFSHWTEQETGVAFSMLPDFIGKPFRVDVINIKLAYNFLFTCRCRSGWRCSSPSLILFMRCGNLFVRLCTTMKKKGVRWAFVFGTVMFFIGCVVGYSVVFPLTLRFLYSYELSPNISNQLSLDSYMSYFLMLIFMMGIMFELPLLSTLLSKLGILNRSFFKKYRRHAVVVLMVVAAVITPSSDPFTLMAVFIPIYILWEISAFLVKPEVKTEN